jgi:hypothetical protein
MKLPKIIAISPNGQTISASAFSGVMKWKFEGFTKKIEQRSVGLRTKVQRVHLNAILKSSGKGCDISAIC